MQVAKPQLSGRLGPADNESRRQCLRLRKTCEYYPGDARAEAAVAADPTSLAERLEHLERLLHVQDDGGGPAPGAFPGSQSSLRPILNDDFPTSYFLDPDHFVPLGLGSLSSPAQPFMQHAWRLVQEDWQETCETYLATIQSWLPMLSRKRLHGSWATLAFNQNADDSLLILCMKLCTQSTKGISGGKQLETDVYSTAKQCCFYAESGGFVSLQLVQSLVLLAVYELGHAIYPAAYLTIGRASRLASVIGLHSRKHTRQLFVDPDTWTLREEQRRTWWAVFVLDR